MKTKCLTIFFFFSIALVLFNNPVFSQDSEWVTVNGIAPIENVTKNEARKMAIANARREAIEKVVGVDILSETMVINYHVSGDVIRTIPHGKVIGQEIIKEEIELIPAKDKGEAHYLAYKVTMRANVIKEKGQIDVFFGSRQNSTEPYSRRGISLKSG